MAIVDAEKLMSQIQGDIDLLEQLRVLYLEEAADVMQKLRSGFNAQNHAAVRSEIHKLKGVLANFMIATPRESLTQVVEVDPTQSESVEKALDRLQTELNAIHDELIEIIKTHPR